jgi:hypothetical protein
MLVSLDDIEWENRPVPDQPLAVGDTVTIGDGKTYTVEDISEVQGYTMVRIEAVPEDPPGASA